MEIYLANMPTPRLKGRSILTDESFLLNHFNISRTWVSLKQSCPCIASKSSSTAGESDAVNSRITSESGADAKSCFENNNIFIYFLSHSIKHSKWNPKVIKLWVGVKTYTESCLSNQHFLLSKDLNYAWKKCFWTKIANLTSQRADPYRIQTGLDKIYLSTFGFSTESFNVGGIKIRILIVHYLGTDLHVNMNMSILCRNQQYSIDFILTMTISSQMSNFPLSYSPKTSKVHIAANQQKLSCGKMLNSYYITPTHSVSQH